MDSVLVASPYLQDPHDFRSSSSASNQFDLSHPDSPYDGFTFEQDFQDNHHFPHTPSYNGSYQGSPYSQISELPAFENVEGSDFGLFADNRRGIAIGDDYDPSEYDIPNEHSLLQFGEAFMPGVDRQVSVSITPPAFDHSSPTSFDHASPGSSNGEDGRRSRASSTSSYMHPNSHPNSPPLDFAQNFESLHFDSPAWAPSHLPVDRPSPPLHKPHSPPQLLIPESPSLTVNDEPPTINAPEGDGGMPAGPQLHIVPATPIGGGVGVARNVQYLQQGVPQDANAPTWDQPQQHLVPQPVNQNMASSNQYTDQSQSFYAGSSQSSSGMAYANAVDNSPPSEQSRHHQYLVPQIPVPRSRSLSDSSRRPPIWDTAPMHGNSNAIVDTVNMNDVLPAPGSSSPSPSPLLSNRHPSSAGPHQSSFGHQMAPPSGLLHHYSYGPPNTSPSQHQQQQMSNDFLSPESIGATSLRRVRSDGMRRFGHRYSQSEDIRSSYPSSLATTTSGAAAIYPPPGLSSQEFISRQYLHPTESVPSIATGRGHQRRSSSGSRERPLGWSSGQSSARASPYPSPSASPRPGYPQLPGSDLGGMGVSRRMGGVDIGMGMGGVMDGTMNVGGNGQMDMPIVSKVNVTTPSTADASQKRRKQPANFVCPVVGCGSTFTRHFNLKGHLRSHAEEKPYQCKWPGCGKGFARQHDCKRHENLHLNIRPYTCEGCKKNFARMDALNRHLRSEGGAECRKIQKEMKPNGEEADTPLPLGPNQTTMKPDPDAWNGGIMM